MRTRLRTRRLVSAAVATLLLATVAASADAHPRGIRRPHAVTSTAGTQPGQACHPGRRTLTYHGGDLVQNVAVFVIFWGSEWQNDAEHQAAAADVRAMFQQLSASEYGCSWREFAVPGSPLGPGSYLGDEIIASAPVGPGQQLPDATIRARIVTEVQANRAPAATDDTFYVVVPPKGVPVIAGSSTGCGGTNFQFCGYHDSFTSGAQRYRYTVLPYPCSTPSGFTCFIDAQHDVGRALQGVGSHELAETVTDPDALPVGFSGWYDDQSGEENADICQTLGCLVDLPVGSDTFTVNSLWSNLGGTCVASAACTEPPPACTEPAPGSCSANTKDPRVCAFEWHVEPNLTRDKNNLAGGMVTCADGQPFCDMDGAGDGQCTFHVALCLNSSDPRFVCAPNSVSAVELRGKLAHSTDPRDLANAATLLSSLATIDPGSTGAPSGSMVTYTPAADTADACGGYIDVVVPVKTSGSHLAKGKRKLTLRAITAAGTVNEKLTLVCQPTFP